MERTNIRCRTFYEEVDFLLRNVRATNDEYRLLRIMAKCSKEGHLVVERTPIGVNTDLVFAAATRIKEEGLATIQINAQPFTHQDAAAIMVAHSVLQAISEGRLKEVISNGDHTKESLATLLERPAQHAEAFLNADGGKND